MLVSSAKSKHSASLMKNQLLDKIIFSVRYLEIWLYTIFLKKISRKQEVLKLLCNFQSRMIVIRERPAWNLTFSCVVRIFSFRSLYFMFSLVMGFFFFLKTPFVCLQITGYLCCAPKKNGAWRRDYSVHKT